MEIKLLTPTDASAYWKLRLEALQQNPEAFATSYEEAIQRANPIEQVEKNLQTEGNYTFGAFQQDKLVGMVTLSQEGYLKMKHRANIFAMYVSPQARGLGAGKALLIEAIDKAKSIKEIEKINLSVVSTNEKAKKLYSQLEFKVFGVEEKALKVADTYYDEDHMVLSL
ncbi:GNAT family N-acetyltransferase [Psychrobacillus lasiicapitis]|uniref:GNAT family N-acetyltransferase n=1 Tax=Psychrobacillus lasiicapitis TaxID=1636719 RepID=A0A544T4Z2_9BACI|nr:GNAT family N-acetyltransferase [Psychrobacillus lasiicapitis]TQR12515.1 GNAT family N-acetyltransferase [Psychrobacillus lasiicapitis]GGA38759.1 N-acetyltransferase [Psychrobacillus lasiicapitis]